MATGTFHRATREKSIKILNIIEIKIYFVWFLGRKADLKQASQLMATGTVHRASREKSSKILNIIEVKIYFFDFSAVRPI